MSAKSKNHSTAVRIAFLASVICEVFIAALILHFVPDKLDTEYIKENYIFDISKFVAEKSEFLSYAVITFTFPILFILFYKLCNRFNVRMQPKQLAVFDAVCVFVTVGLVVGIIFARPTFFTDELPLNNILSKMISRIRHHEWLSVAKRGVIILAGALLLLSVVFLLMFVTAGEKFAKAKRVLKIIFNILTPLFFVTVAFLYVGNICAYSWGWKEMFHSSAYYYPIYKIFSGLTPGVDFDSIYGYYSYFFAGILSLLGTPSILAFSIIIAVLILLILFGLNFFIRQFIKNDVIRVLTVLSAVYLFSIRSVSQGSCYLQYIPHRLLFPVALLVYLCVYLKYRTKAPAALKAGGFVLSALALLWNLETGIVVFGTWACFLGYEILFFRSPREKAFYTELGKLVCMALISPVVYFLILNLITYCRTGAFIGISEILFGASIFAGSGYFMLRMPLWDPWLLAALLYALALAVSIRKLRFMRGENAAPDFKKSSILFSLAVFGAGLFSYYQGRSLDLVLMMASYPSVLIAGIFLDNIVAKYGKLSPRSMKLGERTAALLLTCALTLCSFSTVYCFFESKVIHTKLNKIELFEMNSIEEELSDAKELKQVFGTIDFVLPCESYYYLATEQPDTKRFPGYEDLFTYEDCEKIIKYLMSNEATLCTDSKTYDILTKKYQGEIDELLSAGYQMVTIEKHDWVLFVCPKDAGKIPSVEVI